MGSSYSWHPGSGQINSRWSISVPLQPDEIFSSWLVRAALVQGCDPMTLTHSIWGKWRAWAIDIDRYISIERLKPISDLSGISVDLFHVSTINDTARKIAGHPLPKKNTWPWVITLGSRNTKYRTGIQFCAQCLHEDDIPYFRLPWRFAWITACEKHQCRLRDKCGHCGSPVEPHRLQVEDKVITVCVTCKNKLEQKNLEEKATPNALNFQLATNRLITGDKASFWNESVSTDQWFSIAGFFVSMLRRFNRSPHKSLETFFDSLGINPPANFPLSSGTGIETIETKYREELLSIVWQLMSTDVNQFLFAAEKSGLTRQGFSAKGEKCPDVFLSFYRSLPDNPHPKRQYSGHSTGDPRSRHMVIKMMNRLEKKLQLPGK